MMTEVDENEEKEIKKMVEVALQVQNEDQLKVLQDIERLMLVLSVYQTNKRINQSIYRLMHQIEDNNKQKFELLKANGPAVVEDAGMKNDIQTIKQLLLTRFLLCYLLLLLSFFLFLLSQGTLFFPLLLLPLLVVLYPQRKSKTKKHKKKRRRKKRLKKQHRSLLLRWVLVNHKVGSSFSSSRLSFFVIMSLFVSSLLLVCRRSLSSFHHFSHTPLLNHSS